MRSLRTRLVLSHVLPLLIVLSIVGVALTYLLETQVLLVDLSTELENQARLVAAIARDYPEVWFDAQRAQAFMGQVAPYVSAKVMFFDTSGVLLASSDAADAGLVGQEMVVPGLREAVLTRLSLISYEDAAGNKPADVLMPVLMPTMRVVGVIRLTDPLLTVYERIPRTRGLIVGVLAAGLVVGVILGVLLSVDVVRPLRRATWAMSRMADGYPLETLPEQGPAELRLLLRAFNALAEQLRGLEKARKRLLANLVHEIGRPLGALLSATQALASGAHADPELRHDLLGGMVGEIQRMQHLLDDLTQLYDQSVGSLELNCKATRLAPWLSRVLSPWREVALEKELQWRTDFPRTLPALVIDGDRLAQAVGNIVSNALKYTPAGGRIVIAAGVTDADVAAAQSWIRVRDSGIGIPAEVLPRIFEPFYRGPESRRFPQGMGLGLSIARDLVVAHGGYIDVESVPGEGSVFTLWLPVGEAGKRQEAGGRRQEARGKRQEAGGKR